MSQSFVSLAACYLPGESPGESQARVRRAFPSVVDESPLDYWRSGDPVPSHGRRILVGVATYSIVDLYFLDVLIRSVRREVLSKDHFAVFDFLDCKTMQEVEACFPGIGDVASTPVAGIWRDGVLMETVVAGTVFARISKLYGFRFDSSATLDRQRLRKLGLIP